MLKGAVKPVLFKYTDSYYLLAGRARVEALLHLVVFGLNRDYM